MSDLFAVLDLSRWLGAQGLTAAEHDDLMRFARERIPAGVKSYEEHLRAICMAVERGGQRVLRELVAFAREPKEAQELRFALIAWGNPRMKAAADIGATRAFHDDDLERLRHDIRDKLLELWPHAHDAKIAGAVGTSTSLRGAALSVDWNRIFLAMQEPDTLKRPGDV